MTMTPEQENFESLRRLLVLKRYEQPPPGYFNRFSQQVIERLESGERLTEATLFERLGWEASWLQRFWAAFETKPILAGVLGVAVCGLLVGGIVYSEQVEPTVTTFATGAPQAASAELAQRPASPLFRQTSALGLGNTGPVITVEESSSSSLVDEIQAAHTTPVNFNVRVGN